MTLGRVLITSLCLVASANSVFACVTPRDAAALKVASLQQRLMVAGLACNASKSYNQFVLAHRAELQRSDADLKDYFIRNGSEAGYDAYKTKLANLAAHGPATDQGAFCAATTEDFSALAKSGDLKAGAAGEQLAVGEACEAPILAAATPAAAPPVRIAAADAVLAASYRQPPILPYADAPPPAPVPQPVAAGRDDYAYDRPAPPERATDRATDANVPPRPSYQRRDDLYWYYRQIYERPDAYAGYYGR